MAVALDRRYRFTVDQYHRMAEAGIFDADCRVELVDGVIFEMTPVDPWHSGVVNWLNHRFVTVLGDRAVVHVQNPVGLDPRSEPQRKSCCGAPAKTCTARAHRKPSKPFSSWRGNTSLRRRREAPVMRDSVAEVWIVNRRADAVEVVAPIHQGVPGA